MKKYFVFILALAFVFTVVLIGCEKKTEAPKPAAEPSVEEPAAPAEPTPIEPAPAPEPTPEPEPSKPAKK